MSAEPPLLLALDLAGTFVFGLNGALTAVRVARLDIVGVVALGMATALGGGVIRDVLIGSIPPATFRDWRFFSMLYASHRDTAKNETPPAITDRGCFVATT